MKRIVWLWLMASSFLAIVGLTPLNGQTLDIKHLEHVLSKMRKDDTARIRTMVRLGNAYLPVRVERAKTLGEEALVMAQRIRSRREEASALSLLGQCSVKTGKNAEAIELFHESCKIFEEVRDSAAVASTFAMLGWLYASVNMFDEAVNHYAKAVALRKYIGGTAEIIYAHMQTGDIHQLLSAYPRAAESYSAALAVAERQQDSTAAMRAMYKLAVVFDIAGESTKALEYYERGLTIAEKARNHYSAAAFLNSMGAYNRDRGNFDAALDCYARSLGECGKILNQNAVQKNNALTLRNIGDIHMLRGANADAYEHYRRSLDIWERLGDKNGLAETYGSLGLYFFNVSAFDSSLHYQRCALRLNEQLGDKEGIGCALSNIGMVYQLVLSMDSALACYTRAAALFSEIGSRLYHANALNNIGLIHFESGEYEQAKKYHERAYELRTEIGDQNGIAESLGNLGNVHFKMGAYEKSLDAYLKCLALVEKIGGGDITSAVRNVGVAYREIGSFTVAKRYLERDLSLAKSQGDQAEEALALNELGNLAAQAEGHRAALDYYERSLHICEKTNHKSGIATALSNIGYTYSKMGQHDKGLEFLVKSIDIQEKLGKKDIVTDLIREAEILVRKQHFDGAELYLVRALQLAKKNGAKKEQSYAFRGLSELCEKRGDSARALGYFKAHAEVKDSLLYQENLETMQTMSVRFESEKKIALLEKDRALQVLALVQNEEQLRLQRLQADSAKKEALLLARLNDLWRLELTEKSKNLELQSKDLLLEKAEKEKTKIEMVQATIDREHQENLRNAVMAVFALSLVAGFLAIKRIRAKRTEATLRAEAAEYQTQVAEFKARASETEVLRVQADNERKRREAQEGFSRQLIGSQEQERRHIAGELHDQLGQDLLVIRNAMLTTLHDGDNTPLQEAIQTASSVHDNVRRITRDLRPFQLDRYGLTNALHAMLTRLQQTARVRFTIELESVEGLFPKEHEINIYRIVQESVNNILKHAEASDARVRMTRSDGIVELLIEDNGRGLPTHEHSGSTGFGIDGIRQRTDILGGTFEINSTPGHGTGIHVVLPVSGFPHIQETSMTGAEHA